VIAVEDLGKRYGEVVAVDGMELIARDGEVTGLIGPNGAGKTTTFRTIYGVVEPDRGRAQVDGFDTSRARLEALSRLGVLPDMRGLYPRLTAREHLRYCGRLHGIGAGELEARIEALVERLGMSAFADRRTRGFSRGQELKVALGRALVHAPQNVILDEPTNGLDVESTRAVRGLVREMRDQGRCVLLSSHVMTEVAALCDRLYIVDGGRVAASGTPERLRVEFGTSDLEEIFLRAVGRGERARLGTAI
jgi:sodium transport system ATP-binding protein